MDEHARADGRDHRADRDDRHDRHDRDERWGDDEDREPERTEAQRRAAARVMGDDGVLSYADTKAAQDDFETRLRETGDYEQAVQDVVQEGEEPDDPDPAASMP